MGKLGLNQKCAWSKVLCSLPNLGSLADPVLWKFSWSLKLYQFQGPKMTSYLNLGSSCKNNLKCWTWCSGQSLEILLLTENDYIYFYIYVHLVINIHYRTYHAFFKYKQLQTMLFLAGCLRCHQCLSSIMQHVFWGHFNASACLSLP